VKKGRDSFVDEIKGEMVPEFLEEEIVMV